MGNTPYNLSQSFCDRVNLRKFTSEVSIKWGRILRNAGRVFLASLSVSYSNFILDYEFQWLQGHLYYEPVGYSRLTLSRPTWLHHMMLCTIWYHLYNLKNVKDTHRGELLLVTFRLQLEACNFIKSNIPPWRPLLQLYKKETPTQVLFHVKIAIFLSKNTYGEIEHPRATAFTYTFFLLLEIPTSHMVSNR